MMVTISDHGSPNSAFQRCHSLNCNITGSAKYPPKKAKADQLTLDSRDTIAIARYIPKTFEFLFLTTYVYSNSYSLFLKLKYNANSHLIAVKFASVKVCVYVMVHF